MALSFEEVRENYKRITCNIGEAAARWRRPEDSVRLMAVTKTVPPELVNVAIDCGADLLGENRVQEYLAKKDEYRPGTEVQFIGRIQTNKLKHLIPGVSLIQAVDSFHAAEAIHKLAVANGLTQKILLEVNAGGELSKGGVAPAETEALLNQVQTLSGISACGLMTIPPPGESEPCFAAMQELFSALSEKYPGMTTLSMGMSGDYQLAVRYGATIVRVGSALFGTRSYL